jgi:hypothetical protein
MVFLQHRGEKIFDICHYISALAVGMEERLKKGTSHSCKWFKSFDISIVNRLLVFWTRSYTI